jgi:hypothetical protein
MALAVGKNVFCNMKIFKWIDCIGTHGFGLLARFAAFNFHFLFLVFGLNMIIILLYIFLLSPVGKSWSLGVCVCVCVCVCVFVFVNYTLTVLERTEWVVVREWEPAVSLLSRGGVTSSSQTPPLIEEEAPFRNT